jgi:hypothetical protein
MFWAVPAALEKAARIPGDIDLPLPFVYPLLAQGAGFYPGRVLSDSYARVELTSLAHLLSEMTTEVFAIHREGTFYETISKIQRLSVHLHTVYKSKAWKFSSFMRRAANKIKGV